jgi:hypothetical protein
MKDLLIYHNLGLGDHIICCGLVRHFAKHGRWVHVFVKPPNVESVMWMFQDNPLIVPFPVETDDHAEQILALPDAQKKYEIMRLGCTGPGWTTSEGFDKTFYRQAGVPFEERWSGFHAPPVQTPIYPPRVRYCFVHHDISRGFAINLAKVPDTALVFADTRTRNIFDWVIMLQNAFELHCIPSCFALLADSIPLKEGVKLFLHGSARPGWDRHTTRYQWTIV